eukprot:4195354-Amphidinium_carterae.2
MQPSFTQDTQRYGIICRGDASDDYLQDLQLTSPSSIRAKARMAPTIAMRRQAAYIHRCPNRDIVPSCKKVPASQCPHRKAFCARGAF